MTSEKETPSTHVTVDMAQLASLIASTVKQVLDSQHGNTSQESLGETIGKSVAEGMAKHSRPKVSFARMVHLSRGRLGLTACEPNVISYQIRRLIF